MKRTLHVLLLTVAVLLAPASLTAAAEPSADPAAMKVQDLRAGGDEKKRYFVIQRPGDPPKDGWRTLFVLPGGSGDAEFHPFVTRLAQHAVPEGYLVVQLVRAELAKAHRLDPRYSFTLTWSSSGMSGYGFSLHRKSGITGTFVAMSVFKRDQLPSLTAAKGHPYYLYHSPQDFIPIAQAEAARDALRKAGATVEFQTYAGGHGWHGDPFGDIRQGLTWLEQQAAKAPAR
jgi:hypothetical protein